MRNPERRVALLAAVLAVASVARVGAAQPSDPEALYQQGTQAFERGAFREAAQAFDRAYALDPRGPTAFAAALSWLEEGEKARAADALRDARQAGSLSPEQNQEAATKLDALERELAMLEVDCACEISVAHAVHRRGPLTIHVPPGEQLVVFHLPEGDRTARIVTTAGARERVAPPRAEPPRPAAPVTQPRVEPLPPEDGGFGVHLGFGVASFVASGLAATATATLGGLTLETRSDYEADGFRDRDLYERGTTLRTATNAMLGVSIALAAAGALLVATAPYPRAPGTITWTGSGFRF